MRLSHVSHHKGREGSSLLAKTVGKCALMFSTFVCMSNLGLNVFLIQPYP